MSDVTRLLGALDAYAAVLQRHGATMAGERQGLEHSLARLGALYDGVAAREFHAHWARTLGQLRDYGDGIGAIASLLDERRSTLRRMDRPDGLW